MDKKDYNQIGKDIRDAVQNAVNSMDFSELNRQITASVNDALAEIQGAFDSVSNTSSAQSEEEIRRQAREKLRQMEEEINRRKKAQQDQRSAASRAADSAQRAASAAQQAAQRRGGASGQGNTAGSASAAGRQSRSTTVYRQGRPVSSAVISRRPKGSVSNVVCTVFGSVLLGVAILLALLFGTIAMTGEVLAAPLATVLGLVVLPVGAGGLGLLFRGARERARVERFRTYVSCLKDRKYVKIGELAAAVKKSEKYVRKDLAKMIELDMFPQGHINGDQSMFLLDDTTYAEYETMRQEVEHKSKVLQSETREQKQLRETVERGQAYIAAIRKANDDIPGEEISEKLYRLEKAVARIYVQIQKAPQKLPELRKFQDYYLPTTLKLVEAYREFDAQPIAGDNINTAKAEIEASLDTINQAFEKLFDSLFAETAMDVSTDISVLQTLLAQEGLTEEAWKKATEDGAEYLDMDLSAGHPGGSERPPSGEKSAQTEPAMARMTAGKEVEKETEPDIRLML